MITVLNTTAANSLAKKYAAIGMGEARFTCSHPWPRSMARLTPKPNSDTAITPKQAMVASM